MHGIDISNYQSGINLSELDIDFCIFKITEGIGFFDNTSIDFHEQCVNNNLLFAFYHFARENNPETEAEYFYENCKDYIGHGIPVLDYETDNYNNKEWCERFIQRFYELSGVWCVLYISAGRCKEYYNSWIAFNCGLWVAGYPTPYTTWIDEYPPYDLWPFENLIMWQFTSSLILEHWWTRLDGNVCYISKEAWLKYANSTDYPPIVESEDDMHCIIRPDEADYLVYYDGVNIHTLDHPDEAEAIRKFYKEVTGKDLPLIEFGTKEAPWFHRFADAISHGFSQEHMPFG